LSASRLAGDDLAEQALGRLLRLPGEQSSDVGRPQAPALGGEDRLDLRQPEQAPGHFFMVEMVLEKILRRVAERGVTEIVQQRRGPHQPAAGGVGRRIEQARALGRQGVVDPPGECIAPSTWLNRLCSAPGKTR
jgi:hypothetical protein